MIKLDIGCGYRIKKGFIGVDNFSMDESMLDEMNEEDRKRLKICDVENLPFEDNSVDEIHSSRCLIDFVELENSIGELKRVMIAGAKIYILFTYRWMEEAKEDVELLRENFNITSEEIIKHEGDDEDSWEVEIKGNLK